MSLPWFVAFTAGMVSAFNPCGIALLPSYLAYLLAGRQEASEIKWYSGLLAGFFITLGFSLVFAVAGLLTGVIGGLLYTIVPVVSLVVAVGLLLAAILVWRGTFLTVKWSLGGLMERLEKVFKRGSNSSLLVYGISYGFVSLTCSLPVFLAVVAAGLTVGTRGVIGLFGSFIVGVGSILILLSFLAVVARRFTSRFIRNAIPAIQKLSAVVMAASGIYLVWYWVWGPGLQTIFLK